MGVRSAVAQSRLNGPHALPPSGVIPVLVEDPAIRPLDPELPDMVALLIVVLSLLVKEEAGVGAGGPHSGESRINDGGKDDHQEPNEVLKC